MFGFLVFLFFLFFLNFFTVEGCTVYKGGLFFKQLNVVNKNGVCGSESAGRQLPYHPSS